MPLAKIANLPWSYIVLVYLGTVFYTLAAYYHLSIRDWTWTRAAVVAIPLVLIEYVFSLRGNRYLNEYSGFNPIRILLITMCFYFINLWLLNYFIIGNQIVIWREITGFVLILAAFMVSTNF
jgi:uncharacterized protein (DUF486 family)